MISIDGKSYNELELTKDHPVWSWLTSGEKKRCIDARGKRLYESKAQKRIIVNCIDCGDEYDISEFYAERAARRIFPAQRICTPCSAKRADEGYKKAEEFRRVRKLIRSAP